RPRQPCACQADTPRRSNNSERWGTESVVATRELVSGVAALSPMAWDIGASGASYLHGKNGKKSQRERKGVSQYELNTECRMQSENHLVFHSAFCILHSALLCSTRCPEPGRGSIAGVSARTA